MPQRTAHKSINIHGETGITEIFPDKSLSHRSIILPAISEGVSEISNLLEGDDVLHTIDAMRLAGVKIEKEGKKWLIYGKGLNSLLEPSAHLYLGNSGTSARLLAGVFAPYHFPVFFTGDASLSKRPMNRAFKPLREMGVEFLATSRNTAPFYMKGGDIMPIEWQMEVASAQVKSAILLASCQIQGRTTIIENTKTRDHTENMLKNAGGDISIYDNKITINGGKALQKHNITIPNDPSSSAFLIAVAILCENSSITIRNVCINKTRAGFFYALKQMNANIQFTNIKTVAGEDVADINASYSPDIQGIQLNGDIAPSMIDEYPILFVIASFANGVSIFEGLKELTAKESNRLKIMAENLTEIGVQCNVNYEDPSLQIIGNPTFAPKSTKPIPTHFDHRIAMSCLIAGLRGKVTIDDDTYIKTSFPNFIDIIKNIGCCIS
ncbi:MAG: 3-phosphoshikimate 1-carboxyvinyltransferase [Candidatus Deianiraeaceae bacterium]|jgi:3-phosphoshikimate 1-carboxyvinyltransferase